MVLVMVTDGRQGCRAAPSERPPQVTGLDLPWCKAVGIDEQRKPDHEGHNTNGYSNEMVLVGGNAKEDHEAETHRCRDQSAEFGALEAATRLETVFFAQQCNGGLGARALTLGQAAH